MTNVVQFIIGLEDGGAETLVKDYATLLDRSRFHVMVLTLFPPEGDTANYRHLKNAGIELMSIYPRRDLLHRGIHHLDRLRWVSGRLRQILQNQQVDVLHVHMSLLKYVAPIASALSGRVKLFYTCHSFPEDFFGGEKKRTEFLAAKKLVETCGLQMIAIAEAHVRTLNEMFEIENTIYLHNGIDMKRFSDVQEEKCSIRRSVGIPEDAFVVGNVGRFVPYKNHAFLLEIFRALCTKRTDAFLLLVGSGETKEEIREAALRKGLAERVLILSHRADVPRLLHAMDVFVYPAWYEGLGIVLVEAQAAGLPCCVSDTMQADVYLTERIYPMPLDAPAEMWADAAMGLAAPAASRRYTLADFDMNHVIHILENLYEGAK